MACGGSDLGDDGGGGVDDSRWQEPDPDGRVTEGDLLSAPPEMVVVTTAALADAWAPLVLHRNLSGVRTDLVLLEQVTAEHDGVDQAERLRNYLIAAHERGLRFALLGGDAEVIPYRRVADEFALFDGSYTTNGPSQAYYANLDIDWNADDDASWGEDLQDVTLTDLRTDEIAVGRVPASHAAEVERYVSKLVRYETAPGGRETYPLLFSDIAQSGVPLLGDIDGAEGVEASVQAFFPQEFIDNTRRLYATEGAASTYGGEVITPQRFGDALDQGYLLAYHNGHGSHASLTGELDADFVRGLANPSPTVLLSCACLAGNFADVADGAPSDYWEPQGVDEDSAGELLITGAGGAVGYVGSTGVGLGPIGGSQFLHGMFEGIFERGLTTLGEAFAHGRARMRSIDLQILNTQMIMTDDSERWTQLVVILLGDPALRLWTRAATAIEVIHPAEYGPGFNQLTIEVRSRETGLPIADATVVVRKADDFLIRRHTGADGRTTFRFVPYDPLELEVGVTGPGLLPEFTTIAPSR